MLFRRRLLPAVASAQQRQPLLRAADAVGTYRAWSAVSSAAGEPSAAQPAVIAAHNASTQTRQQDRPTAAQYPARCSAVVTFLRLHNPYMPISK